MFGDSADHRGNMGDLIAATLTSGEPTAETLKAEAEGPLDVVRLQPASPGLLHEPLHLSEVGV